jgi:internalin A
VPLLYGPTIDPFMSQEEEANAEALRRIQEAENTGITPLDLSGLYSLYQLFLELNRLKSLQTLNLSECRQLSGDLSPLAGLKSLQTLNLTGCEQLSSDLSPLAGLESLQTLNLDRCEQLSDLSPLAWLESLQTLNLVGCLGIRRFAQLESLLPTLWELHLFGCRFEDVPSEVCGEAFDENVLAKVRAHYEDLKSGQRHDAEVKVLFLGNGTTGKSQLCRRLRDLD